MIERIMSFLGGVLVASLLALMLMSVIHDRAVRLTRRRILEALPESLVEVQIEKEHQRAKFAMSARLLERSIEQLEFKTNTQLGEIGRKGEAISRLKTELARRIEVTDELARKVDALAEKIKEGERERIRNQVEVFSMERALSLKEVELVRSSTEHGLVIQALRAETASLNAQIERYQLAINQLQQLADPPVNRPFDEPMVTLAIIKDLEEEYHAARYWQPGRQIVAEIARDFDDDAVQVFAQPGSIAPDQ